MKLHWGHKIAIVYSLFAGFMIFMLVLSMQEKHELVTENYYENELAVQGRIDADKNMKAADFKVDISSKNREILLSFKGLPSGEIPTGKVNLYKPDDISLDESMEVKLDRDKNMMIKPVGDRGRYTVSIRFEVSGKDYYTEKQIVL